MENKANNPVPIAVAPGYPGSHPQYGYPQYAPGVAPYPAPQGFPGAPAQPPYAFPTAYGAPTTYGQPVPHAVWMPEPPTIPNCPPGLEYLSQIDQILIHQQIELLEIITGFETANKYEIKNAMGQRVYFAAEENDCCTLNCCGPSRPFTMKVMDNMGREVINLTRPLRCSSCCCPCCLQEIEVHAPLGTPVGYVKQTWDPCLPKFVIQNEAREDVLKIVGPCVVCSCCSDIDFEVLSLDGNNVGKISKQWTGFVREAFTDADNFGIQFPMDLDVKIKAVMLGACFLIDFMFFEHTGQNRQQRAGVW
ncbi:phospholipid scramblase 1-like [Notechis scutatus]|uniref:Phospholipid scramblase n=1 Tax=Notechis scutatus TaxID=8663 RepID=A0A6J1TPM9_9SAUR|nr:phospholipid scramblase 1-like [Notechis scutatus]